MIGYNKEEGVKYILGGDFLWRRWLESFYDTFYDATSPVGQQAGDWHQPVGFTDQIPNFLLFLEAFIHLFTFAMLHISVKSRPRG